MSNEKNKIYWEKREASKLNKGIKDINKLERELKKHYTQAMDAISKEIAFLMSKYATENNLSYDEASKLLNSKELKEFRYDVKTYIKLIEDTFDEEVAQNLLLELNTLSMKTRISRLEEIFYQCDKYINELTKTTERSIQTLLSDTVRECYYTTLYDVHKFVGVATTFAKVDDDMIRQILKYPWSGKDYSQRIWNNRNKLRETIREEITQMVIQGKGSKEVAKSMSNKLDAHYKNCLRVVNTEHSYVLGEASARAYEETDVEKYEFVATLDKRTSEICKKLDGKVFKLSERVVGVNASPLHPNCRSCEVPYFENDTPTTRFARDSKGKGIEVPANMTYKEWAKIYKVD